jgi:hypothetical protein
MVLRKLNKEAVQATPWVLWNGFVDLIAKEDYRDLDAIQRPAHLVFWYESEVQNGGHLQYFENRGTEHLAETITSLGVLGAIGQQQVLHEAGELYLGRSRPRIASVEEFCATALGGEFAVFDRRFHECAPLLQQCLESYLRSHQSSFVVVV